MGVEGIGVLFRVPLAAEYCDIVRVRALNSDLFHSFLSLKPLIEGSRGVVTVEE